MESLTRYPSLPGRHGHGTQTPATLLAKRRNQTHPMTHSSEHPVAIDSQMCSPGDRPAPAGRGRSSLAPLVVACLAAVSGCWSPSSELVVYAALDQEFSQPQLQRFAAATGIQVAGKFDVESTKTVGLTNAIIAESKHPRCDVFWNNEILNTLRLQKRGLLRPYDSVVGRQFPSPFRDPQGHWYGFAARARVLLVNTNRISDAGPTSIRELVDPKWKQQVAIAKPLFGTTATHATVLFHRWGTTEAESFFRRVAENARVLSGNKQVALAVARGQVAWGLTDTDDAIIELEKGQPVRIVYPDQADGHMGTLFIPNTVAIIAGSPHPQAAEQFVDFVLSAEVERALAAGPSAQIPLSPSLQIETRVATPRDIRPLAVDFAAAADSWETAAPRLREIFLRTASGAEQQ